MQCLVGHGQLWGWRGTQGSQKSWVGKMLESPSPVLGAEAVRGARERQLWGWRKAQGRQRLWAGLGPKAPLCVGETAAGSGMSWRATVAAPRDGFPVRVAAGRPLGSGRGRRPRQERLGPLPEGERSLMSAQAPLTVAQRKRCRAKDTKARRSPIEEPAWVARKLTKRSVPLPTVFAD